jgi:hypothetical protein
MSKVSDSAVEGGLRLLFILTFFTALGFGLITHSFGWGILAGVGSFLFYMFGLAFMISKAESEDK